MTLKLIKFLFIVLVLTECKKPVSPEDIFPDDPGKGQNHGSMTIQNLLKEYLKSTPNTITDDVSVTGQIVSSDWMGAFPHSLIVMDESGAIEIRLASENYHRYYELGRIVTVRCAGLVIRSYGNSPILGRSTRSEEEYINIPEYEMNSFIVVSGQIEPISKPTLNLSEISGNYNNLPVILQNVEFIDEDKEKEWCDPDSDYSYTERILKSTKSNDSIAVRTHYNVRFKRHKVSAGTVDIEGILQYYYSKPSLQLIDYADMNL